MNDLAIVIPAYKASYFREALDSLANQTNKDFHVYIGDDKSPENLEEIVRHYSDFFPLSYHRFSFNMGGRKIVKQWERCVALTRSEEWIWIFSDDDKMDPNAVEAFRSTLEQTGGSFDLYSFNTCVIKKNGEKMGVSIPAVPEMETSESLAVNLLLQNRANCMADHIFSRRVYEKNKGFVKTRYGQGADWATSVLFSLETGVRYIHGAMIYWRYSGDNLTSLIKDNRVKMMGGFFQFMRWMTRHFSYLKTAKDKSRYFDIENALYTNLKQVIRDHFHGIPNLRVPGYLWLVISRFQVSVPQIIRDIQDLNRKRDNNK